VNVRHLLRTKLGIAFILVAFVPASLTGSYAVHISGKSLKSQALTQEKSCLKILKTQIEAFLATVKSDVFFLAQSMPMKNYLDWHMTVLSAQPHQLDETALTVLEQKRQIMAREFLAFARHRRIYHHIYYLNTQGKQTVAVSSDGFKHELISKAQLKDHGQDFYFKEANQLGQLQLFVSPLTLNRQDNEIELPYQPIIRYALNVYYQNRQKAGLLVLEVNAQQFLKLLDAERLITQAGYFAYHPDLDKRWGGEQELNSGYSINQEYSQLQPSFPEAEGQLKIEDKILIYQKVDIPGSTQQWILFREQDTQTLFKEVMLFYTTFFVILLLIIVAVLIFALLFSAKVTYAIEYLTRRVYGFQQGQFLDSAIEIKDKGELGQLAQALEQLRQRLKIGQ